jgi:diaminopimelate decarboxylase
LGGAYFDSYLGAFFARDRGMPDVQSGDLLAVLTTGAHGFVLPSNYNTRPRPAEVLVNGAEAELIRERETVEGLMAREKL